MTGNLILAENFAWWFPSPLSITISDSLWQIEECGFVKLGIGDFAIEFRLATRRYASIIPALGVELD